eukprot:8279385-Pyramimonas_sp.AAC.1
MPGHAEAWESCAQVVLRLQLGRAAGEAHRPWLSARILAGDREEPNKVRPLALGNFHRRTASKAVSRVFRGRVAAALGVTEYSVGDARGAERMHKAALLDLDSRPSCCKLSLDVSNAHNEFSRESAARAVHELVPDMLPWVRLSLCTDTTH